MKYTFLLPVSLLLLFCFFALGKVWVSSAKSNSKKNETENIDSKNKLPNSAKTDTSPSALKNSNGDTQANPKLSPNNPVISPPVNTANTTTRQNSNDIPTAQIIIDVFFFLLIVLLILLIFRQNSNNTNLIVEDKPKTADGNATINNFKTLDSKVEELRKSLLNYMTEDKVKKIIVDQFAEYQKTVLQTGESNSTPPNLSGSDNSNQELPIPEVRKFYAQYGTHDRESYFFSIHNTKSSQDAQTFYVLYKNTETTADFEPVVENSQKVFETSNFREFCQYNMYPVDSHNVKIRVDEKGQVVLENDKWKVIKKAKVSYE